MAFTRDRWTNASVKLLAGDADPVEAITRKARAVVLDAMDGGWSGPPFDPLSLSDHLKLDVVPRGDVRDARIVPIGQGFRIEYNPTRPRGRVRYSIAHEIAHTLFADCADQIRNRATREEIDDDEWQLEALCNIAAAEFLMPAGSLGRLDPGHLGIDNLLDLRQKYDVSTEAILIRATHASPSPCAAFSASRIEGEENFGEYRLDYLIGSSAWTSAIGREARLGATSVMSHCWAIGYTAKGVEQIDGLPIRIECVGIPPYPGSTFPRVAGILMPVDLGQSERSIIFVRGDALEPRGDGLKIIAHIVNDVTPNWGGKGFAQALRRKWPHLHEAFTNWAIKGNSLSLGHVHFESINERCVVASMVSQRGFGPSARARLSYAALESCLRQVSEYAWDRGASVHMPRIGCGAGGGSWELVEELINCELLARAIPALVYDLPGANLTLQSPLLFAR